MIHIDEFAEINIDEINRLLSGDIDSIAEIFLDDKNLVDNLQRNRKDGEMLLKETAILGDSLAGKTMAMDSTIAIDSEFIVNINKQINGLQSKLAPHITKPETINKKILECRNLFENDLVEMTSLLNDWSNRIRVYDQIELDDEEIDLLVKHYAAILESVRLDNEIDAIQVDINILERELS